MKYKNISDSPQSLPTALGEIIVHPGETGLTSPKVGKLAIASGNFELVLQVKPATRSTPKVAKKETAE